VVGMIQLSFGLTVVSMSAGTIDMSFDKNGGFYAWDSGTDSRSRKFFTAVFYNDSPTNEYRVRVTHSASAATTNNTAYPCFFSGSVLP